MTVSGTVSAASGPASAVAGAVVRARNLDTGQVEGQATTDMSGAYAIEGLPGDRYSIEVTPPSGYLSTAPVLVARPESGDPAASADFSLLFYTRPEGTVTTVPAGELTLMPANFFDLGGKTLTFIPNGAGYSVEVGGPTWEDPGRSPSVVATRRIHGQWFESVPVELPFPFPYAGQTWTRLHANANGNLSFQRSESENWDWWSESTTRSKAAAVDSRAAAGLETMIAALWQLYDHTDVTVDSTPARAVFTWRAVRPTPGYNHAPLGENVFQARLYPSGVVEFAYRAVPERDGFVGLFHGGSARGATLDAVRDAVGDVAEPVLDITGVELVDNGSTVLARMTLAADIPEEVADGTITYRIFLQFGEYDCRMGIEVTTSGRVPSLYDGGCGPPPGDFGRVQGATVEMYFSKTRLHGADRFVWNADAVWWGRDQYDGIFEDRPVRVDTAERDFGAMERTLNGNVFEAFHYPVFPKPMIHAARHVYRTVPADGAQIVVLFTDFEFDDLYGQGPGSGTRNEPILGIGPGPDGAGPHDAAEWGSDTLLVTMSPVFLGGPAFWNETADSDGRPYGNFGIGIRWIAHEATHRWVAHMSFRNPRTGQIEALRDDGVHWSHWLHAPAVFPVWPEFASSAYTGASVNGGGVWTDNGDGTFTRTDDAWNLPSGLSALDLYAMGMIPPEEVPDTFILRAPPEGAEPQGTVRATKVPVRIEDVIAAVGPRVPAAGASRKEFRLGVYLLHDGPTPRPDMVHKARRVSEAVAEYFYRATDGRMLVIPQ